AYLGECINNLKNVNIPKGFVITVLAYKAFMEHNDLSKKIKNIISTIKPHNLNNLSSNGEKIRQLILNANFPDELISDIKYSYESLEKIFYDSVDVSLRSSATIKDKAHKNFEDYHETFLNVRGSYSILDACKKCFASIFTNRSISFIIENKIDIDHIKGSIGIQKMVRSDLASSGNMYTIDNHTGFKNTIHIFSSYGIYDKDILSHITPDEFYVFRKNISINSFDPIINKISGKKTLKKVYDMQGTKRLKLAHINYNHANEYSINNNDIITLAKIADKIEKHFKNSLSKNNGLRISWAKDENDKIWILQILPEHVHSKADSDTLIKYKIDKNSKKTKILALGEPVTHKIAQGRAHIIKSIEQANLFRKGQVLVTDMTDPDWEPIMKKASAVVINKGGRTCHAALFSKELGIPCIVGTKNSTQIIKPGQNITVDCDSTKGIVYNGLVDFSKHMINIHKIPKTKTKIRLNISSPSEAYRLSQMPVDGVGLARSEFIINSNIKIHPNALIDYDNLNNLELKSEIDKLTMPYKDKKQFFIDKFSYDIGTIAAAFYPKDVIIRCSDFHTNEYANLIGGHLYEFKEDNPMLGLRGVSRYKDKDYQKAFELECKAIKKARDNMGLKNIIVMLPFCRTPNEAKEILRIMKKFGLKQKKNGLKIYCMAEIPSNAILIEEFCKIFDGFSIGSNDLTQLTLGIDRDSEKVSNIFDEKNPAVKKMIEMIVKTCKKHKKPIGFCGDAVSSIPGYAEYLVSIGIDSVSLTPDAIIQTILHIYRTEQRVNSGKKVFSLK
ncbi:MAG: phosphoenolpyruvate synthase, partial [bacterium]